MEQRRYDPNGNGLAPGEIKVTVTDAIGCSGALTVLIDVTATNEIEGLRAFSLQPNPTSDVANLQVKFDRPVDAGVQVLDLLGRVLWETNVSATTDLNESINFGKMPDGLYLVRLTVNGQLITKKLVKQQ